MDDVFELARQRRNAARREMYRLDGGKRKAENQAWKEAHREEVRAAGREYQRLLRDRNPEHAKSLQKKHYAAHKGKRQAATRAWFKAHPEYINEKQAEYRKKDPVKFMLRNVKNRAKRLGLEFSLTRADVPVPEFCPVFGVKLEWGHGKVSGFFSPASPSVDRMDSSKGYTPDNVRVICWEANMLKRDATLEKLKKIVAYMERQ